MSDIFLVLVIIDVNSGLDFSRDKYKNYSVCAVLTNKCYS